MKQNCLAELKRFSFFVVVVLLSFVAPQLKLLYANTVTIIDEDTVTTKTIEAKQNTIQPRALNVAKPDKLLQQGNLEEVTENPWNGLPLVANRFIVDDTVNSIRIKMPRFIMTAVKLLDPKGNINTMMYHEKNLHWPKPEQNSEIYIVDPKPGQWELRNIGDLLPIVEAQSDLVLRTKTIPGNIFLGEKIPLQAELLFQNKKPRKDLLKKARVHVILENSASVNKYKIHLKDHGRGVDKNKSDGIFTHEYRSHELPGIYRINFYAKGTSFLREQLQQIYVHDYPGKVFAKYNLSPESITLQVELDKEKINVENALLLGLFYEPTGKMQSFEIKNKNKNMWSLDIPVPSQWKYQEIVINLLAKTPAGRSVDLFFSPTDVQGLYQAALEAENVKRRQQLISRDTLQLGHVLVYSREKSAEMLAEIAQQKHYPDILPPFKRSYMTQLQLYMHYYITGRIPKGIAINFDKALQMQENEETRKAKQDIANSVAKLREEMRQKELAKQKELMRKIKAQEELNKKQAKMQSEPIETKNKTLKVVLIFFTIFVVVVTLTAGVIYWLWRRKAINLFNKNISTDDLDLDSSHDVAAMDGKDQNEEVEEDDTLPPPPKRIPPKKEPQTQAAESIKAEDNDKSISVGAPVPWANSKPTAKNSNTEENSAIDSEEPAAEVSKPQEDTIVGNGSDSGDLPPKDITSESAATTEESEQPKPEMPKIEVDFDEVDELISTSSLFYEEEEDNPPSDKPDDDKQQPNV